MNRLVYKCPKCRSWYDIDLNIISESRVGIEPVLNVLWEHNKCNHCILKDEYGYVSKQ